MLSGEFGNEFLNFMKKKMAEEGEVVVDKKGRTLSEALIDAGVVPHKLTADTLGMKAKNATFHRFDHFNDSYNPLGSSDLRTVFMKTRII